MGRDREDLLDLLEGLPVDGRLVASLALDALMGHDPDVVVIAQDAIDIPRHQPIAAWCLFMCPT
jgi:hypothetical protein